MVENLHRNKVEFIGWYGGDEAIALSAWTSTNRDLTPEKKLRIPALIKKLWEAEPLPHGTPFEKGIVHFLVDSDVASHIQSIKHRIGVSVNGESARYKELKEDKYYLPYDWGDIKCTMDGFTDKTWLEVLEEHTQQGNLLYHAALQDLQEPLGRKRAKETARYFKGYNTQTTTDVMFNMRSFHNFLTQRYDDHAQLEIREIAGQMLEMVRNIKGQPFKHTLAAWGY